MAIRAAQQHEVLFTYDEVRNLKEANRNQVNEMKKMRDIHRRQLREALIRAQKAEAIVGQMKDALSRLMEGGL
jgi:hypothetical protein